MPKFIITVVTNYEVEADSMEDLRADWHNAGEHNAKYEYELQDGHTTFTPIENSEK